MNIKLSNGTELTPVMVTGGQKYVQGQSRDTLSFVFAADAGMETLDAAFTEAACESITIVGDDGTENIHKGYTIRAELSKTSVETTPATEPPRRCMRAEHRGDVPAHLCGEPACRKHREVSNVGRMSG